jgi:hypothetical protein
VTITLKLKPEVEAGLLTQAKASGMTLEEYVLAKRAQPRMDGKTKTPARSQRYEISSAEERAAAFEAWSAGHRPSPLLSDYAVSREAMYKG